MVFALSMFYLLVIGRRTPVLMIGIAFIVSFLYEMVVLKRVSPKLRKNFISLTVLLVVIVLCIVLIYSMNLFNLQTVLKEYHIFQKFSQS